MWNKTRRPANYTSRKFKDQNHTRHLRQVHSGQPIFVTKYENMREFNKRTMEKNKRTMNWIENLKLEWKNEGTCKRVIGPRRQTSKAAKSFNNLDEKMIIPNPSDEETIKSKPHNWRATGFPTWVREFCGYEVMKWCIKRDMIFLQLEGTYLTREQTEPWTMDTEMKIHWWVMEDLGIHYRCEDKKQSAS
jgi:hypothetical protein